MGKTYNKFQIQSPFMMISRFTGKLGLSWDTKFLSQRSITPPTPTSVLKHTVEGQKKWFERAYILTKL